MESGGDAGCESSGVDAPRLRVNVIDPLLQDAAITLQRVSPAFLTTTLDKLTVTFFYSAPMCVNKPCVVRFKLKQGHRLVTKATSTITLDGFTGSVTISAPIDSTLSAGTAELVARILPHKRAKWKHDYFRSLTSILLVDEASKPLLCSSTTLDKSQFRKKNVLFIMIDDLGDQLGVYGHPQAQTPNIDLLASKGTRFDNHYVDAPICIPSRVAVTINA